MSLTHFDAAGQAHMVDVSDKAVTSREAVAQGRALDEVVEDVRLGGKAGEDPQQVIDRQ